MNIPTHCTNCDTTEGVSFVCRGCKFARFCSRDCLKKCWKKHKRYCTPLTDALNNSIEIIRPFLRCKYRINDKELHCMFCLEGGTSENPLFHSGCACRPDSGMSIGHIDCFQELARASFADVKKKEERWDGGVGTCSNCHQDRNGIHKFETLLILSKLYDPDCLSRQNVQGIDSARANLIRNALQCLASALSQPFFNSAHNDFITFCGLRVVYLIKNVRKQMQLNEYVRMRQEIAEDFDIGRMLINSKKYQAAIDFNRRNYEKLLLKITRYPQLKQFSHYVVHNYANSLLLAFKASSLKSDVGNDPPYHYLEEAEPLIRKAILENNHDDLNINSIHNTGLLCNILICHGKYAEARRILSPRLQKVQRVFGASHYLTKSLLVIDAQISTHI